VEPRVIRRVVAATALVAVGVACAVLASDVRSTRTSLSAGDALYAAGSEHVSWVPHTRLGGLAGDVVGVSDDVAAREALQRYASSANLALRLDNALAVQTARARAQDALATVAAKSDGKRAGQMLTLLGVLTFRSSAAGTADQVDAAIADFVSAIRADPSNDAAKFDLELLLRRSAVIGSRIGPGLGGGFGRGGHLGAGGGTPGRGY
jgi:hypothetical protein